MNHHNILTPKGERYVAEYGNVLVAFRLRDPLFAVPGITATDVRDAVETEIDRLIYLLDAFEDDPDLEDTGDNEPSFGVEINGICELELDTADDEPSLGAPEVRTASNGFFYSVVPGAPLVEHIQPLSSQGSWAQGSVAELEQDIQDEPHDGDLDLSEGDNSDFEPSLGSPEIGPSPSYWISTGGMFTTFGGSQERWANGASDMEEESVNEDGDESETAS